MNPTPHDPLSPPPPPPLPNEAADPLAAVVDDETPRREALAWAVARLEAGAAFEEVEVALAGAGWQADDTAEVVELARQVTRPLRGARSRRQEVDEANRRHRKATTGGWFVGFPTVAAGMRLLQSLGTLGFLRKRGGDREGRGGDAP
jgi:hypothetical protein